jgi:hypothetical protein
MCTLVFQTRRGTVIRTSRAVDAPFMPKQLGLRRPSAASSVNTAAALQTQLPVSFGSTGPVLSRVHVLGHVDSTVQDIPSGGAVLAPIATAMPDADMSRSTSFVANPGPMDVVSNRSSISSAMWDLWEEEHCQVSERDMDETAVRCYAFNVVARTWHAWRDALLARRGVAPTHSSAKVRINCLEANAKIESDISVCMRVACAAGQVKRVYTRHQSTCALNIYCDSRCRLTARGLKQ